MKLAAAVAILAAMTAAHAMVVQRDDPVRQAIEGVTVSVRNLDAVTKAFDGNNIQPVVQAADAVAAACRQGQSEVKGAPDIDVLAASRLLGSVQDLERAAKVLFDDVKARVSAVEKAKACDVARAKMGVLSADGGKLVDVIIGKMTSALAKAVAAPYADEIKRLLARARDLFAVGHCVNNAW
ncbi:Cell wall galactomannoprotein [Metarhizium album ARSEF 1941]|uniref:Cell wall galactomannoprotein n=1 Tax=Metarhizium album (strain ARSEF 1941) TaxID=1081103 RepID=A0A0B2WJ42_METAS|nr:Cell wall galactomannoprotein [Metarhizium album ARSEF 1941]KHN93893.1 Cell wall galactomannoprotein [Metarhizium album ARSEF 1941]